VFSYYPADEPVVMLSLLSDWKNKYVIVLLISLKKYYVLNAAADGDDSSTKTSCCFGNL